MKRNGQKIQKNEDEPADRIEFLVELHRKYKDGEHLLTMNAVCAMINT